MAYKRQRNLYVSSRITFLKNYLKRVTEKGLSAKKSIWKFIKPFLTNKGFISNDDVTFIHKNKIIADKKQLTKLFNNYYINIVEKSSCIKPKTFGVDFENTNIRSIGDIVNSYKNHLSIKSSNK